MKSFIKEQILFLLLILILIVSEIIVNPIGNFPLNDDWTYGKSEMLLSDTGKLDIGEFPAMTLLTHLLWGTLFTKIFGFSFTVLRFSTIVSSIIGMFFLNKLVINITTNKVTAFFACLAILFNPLYFNLSNTYMTDVNFNTIIIMCCYFAYVFFKSGKLFPFLMVFILSALLVLLRQFGLIVPASFVFCCLFLREKKWNHLGLAVVLSIAVFAIFKYYEIFLKAGLDANAAYQFSDGLSITQRVFWDNFYIKMMKRHPTVLLHVLLYAFPFVNLFIISLLREFKAATVIVVFAVSIISVFHVFKDEQFPFGNIFENTNLGAETFFETLHPNFKSVHEHTWSETFNSIATAMKYSFILLTVVCITLMLLKLVKMQRGSTLQNPGLLFFGCLFLSYGFLLFVPDSFFDRYHIPLITLTIILLTFANKYFKISPLIGALSLVIFFYISVFGTKDYLELNRKRWEAYYFLKDTKHIDYKKIDGGFEINSWNEGKKCVLYDYLDLDKYDYLIQYRRESGFRPVKELEFQRYFPYKKDKIYIFVNERQNH